MRRVTLLFAVCCALLAQLGFMLMQILDGKSQGLTWQTAEFYDLAPAQILMWASHALAIGLVVALAVVLRHVFGFGRVTSFFAAGALGVVFVPAFLGTTLVAMFEPWDGAFMDTFHLTLGVMLFKSAMAPHLLTGFAASMLGVSVGHWFVSNPPSGGPTFREVVARARSFTKKLGQTRHIRLRLATGRQ